MSGRSTITFTKIREIGLILHLILILFLLILLLLLRRMSRRVILLLWRIKRLWRGIEWLGRIWYLRIPPKNLEEREEKGKIRKQ